MPQRLIASHAAAAVAMSLPWPLLLFVVWDSTHSDALIALTAAARMLPYVACSWAAGRLADRYPRDRIVRATVAARLGLLTITTLALAQGRTLVAVLAASAAVAAATPAYPALAAALPELDRGRRRRTTDLLVTAEAGSFVVGPAVGGLLLAPATRPWTGVAAVLLTLLAGALLARVRLPAARSGDAGPSQGGALRGLVAWTGVGRAVLTVGVVNAVAAGLGVLLLPFAEQVWREGERGFGVATAALGLGALTAPLLGWVGRAPGVRVRGCLVVLVVPVAAVALTPHLAWAVLPLALAGAAAVQVESAATEVIQLSVPDRSRAGMLGLTDSVMVGAALLGSLGAPLLGEHAGGRAAVLLLAAIAALPLAHRRRSAQTDAPAPPGAAAGSASPAPTASTDRPAAAPATSSDRAIVVRSGTSRMNSTATRASTANGVASRNT